MTYEHDNKQLDFIDLGSLIFNRSHQNTNQTSVHDSYNSIILLADNKTCLPCENIIDMVTINPDKVCWRSDSSERKWLAGTFKKENYILLDLDGIMQLLTAT